MEDSGDLKNDEELQSSTENKNIQWLRLLRTVLLVLAFIGWGMSLSMVFASMPDLRVRLNTTVEEMSYAFALGSIGSLIATPLGILTDRVGNYSALILGLCLAMASISNMIKPFSTVLWLFGICGLIETLSWSLMNTVSNSLVMLMWGEAGNSPLHVMYLGYPLGAVIGGQIAYVFVSKNTTGNTSDGSEYVHKEPLEFLLRSTIHDFDIDEESQQNEFLDESQIEIGFIIIACFNLTVGLFCCIVQFVGTKETTQKANKRSYSWDEISHPSKWGAGDARFALILFFLFVLLQIALVGCDIGTAQYLATYAVDSDLGFDNQEAASLTSIYYLCELIALFFCIYLARFLSLRLMVFIEVHGITVVAILIVFFGTQDKIALYVLAPMVSVFKGPAWASIFAWPDYYITLLSTILAVAGIVRGVVSIFMNMLQGYLYTNTVIESIFYTTAGYGGIMCILSYFIYYVTWNRPGRHQLLKEQSSTDLYDISGTLNINYYFGNEQVEDNRKLRKLSDEHQVTHL